MKKLFKRLIKQAQHSKLIQCTDATITICSSQQMLVDSFHEPLLYLLPEPPIDESRSITCLVEPTSVLKDWPTSIEASGPATKLDHEELGPSQIIPTEPGATVLVDRIGSIYHSGNGEFLCLVKPPEKELEANELQDVSEFLTVLISETLLLVNKLLIHAGCVGLDGACRVWAGDGGSGKTTQVISMVGKGWDFYGEDQLIVGKDANDTWTIWPYWRRIYASAETCKLFPTQPDLSNRTANSRDKYAFRHIQKILDCRRPFPGQLADIYLLVPGNKNILTDLDFNESFSQVASGFLHSLLPGSIGQAMDVVLDLLASVPVKMVSWDMLDQVENPDIS